MLRHFLFALGFVYFSLAIGTADAQAKKDPPKEFTNSIGMKFVWIAPGTFMMGSPEGEEEGRADESQHKVTLSKGFYMGVQTVTQEQWTAIIAKNPSKFKGEKNLPVDNVSWNDCQAYIKELRKKDKKPYRLPTEAEWEYSCRAGTTTPFHFGETISTDKANYDGNFAYGTGKKGLFREKTTPVGSFPPNAWGLHDVHGNVFQWCQDWYGDYSPKDTVDPTGPEKGERRILRGGSWHINPARCRSAYRGGFEPNSGNELTGFRLCFSLDFEARDDSKGEKRENQVVYFERGVDYLQKGKYDDALSDLTKGIDLWPDAAGLYFVRGLVNHHKKNLTEAVDDYNRALVLDPKYRSALINRGAAFFQLAKYDKALGDYERVVEINPRDSEGYGLQAACHLRKLDYDKAISTANKAIELDQKSVYSLCIRGVAYSKKSLYEKAIDSFKSAIEANPEAPQPYKDYAWLLATCPENKVRNGKKAIELAERAIKLLGKDRPYFLETLAAAFAEAGNYEKAVEWQKRVLSSPNLLKEDVAEAEMRLSLYLKRTPFREEAKSRAP